MCSNLLSLCNLKKVIFICLHISLSVTIRSSMGACFHIPIKSFSDWSETEAFIPLKTSHNLSIIDDDTISNNSGGNRGASKDVNVYAADVNGSMTYAEVKTHTHTSNPNLSTLFCKVLSADILHPFLSFYHT